MTVAGIPQLSKVKEIALLERFLENIHSADLFSKEDALLLAASGGADSVVLCELCKRAGFNFSIAHCNFQLRGEESERDERFVKGLGEKYGVTVLAKRFETEKYAASHKLSIQEAARDLRYDWFAELIKDSSTPPRFLLTAHHADDNNETVMMNFFRGTGLHGLTGIPQVSGHIRRPLLIFYKSEILEFVKIHQLNFVEDSSNLSSKYTRNFFRNEVMPMIETAYPAARQNLAMNIERFKEIESLYQVFLSQLKKKIFNVKGKEIHLAVKQLMAWKNRALIYEIISGFGFTDKYVDEVIKLSESDSGKYIVSPVGDYRIIKHGHWFIISPTEPLDASNIIIEQALSHLRFQLGELAIRSAAITNFKLSEDPWTASLDAKLIEFPLLLRKWKAGDYFYPLGMRKKKKLSRFLIDQKLSRTDKEKIWVLEMNQKIIWVPGHRIDDRFKITGKTRDCLSLTLKREELL